MNKTIIGIIIGILLIGGLYLFMQNKDLQQDANESDINITLPLTDTNGR